MRRRIAYFSPLPPVRSGIADYSYELLPALARYADVTLFVPAPGLVIDSLREQFDVRSIESYSTARWDYDVALYHMGNSEYHEAIFPMLLRYPGITVLHEYYLHHFVAAHTFVRGDFSGYVREVGYELGLEGIQMAYQVRSGKREMPLFELPLNKRVLDSSLGVIVHSQHLCQLVRERCPDLPMAVVPAPIYGYSKSLLLTRQDLGCPDGAPIFASAGQMTEAKQIDVILEAFARLREEFPKALYLMIGEDPAQALCLDDRLKQYDLQESVVSTGYVPDIQQFVSWIAAADVLINLRHPTVGETSATALRGLAAGRPVIVSDDGWYAELPGDVCVKIPPDDVDALLAAMRKLAAEEPSRREMGERAYEYAHRFHEPDRAAQAYVNFVDELLTAAIEQWAVS